MESLNTSAPPRAVLSHGHRAHERAPTAARRAVQYLTLSVFLLFLLGGAVSLILWLSLHPRLPTFRLESLSVSGFNLSASQLMAKYNIELSITNPNRKLDLQIDHLDLSVVYQDVTLSRNVMGLTQCLQILRNRSCEVELEMVTDGLTDKMRKRVAGDLGGDWSKGVVNFNVKMSVWVNFRAGGWLAKQKVLSVICKNLNVEFVYTKGKDTGKIPEDGWSTCTVDFE